MIFILKNLKALDRRNSLEEIPSHTFNKGMYVIPTLNEMHEKLLKILGNL